MDKEQHDNARATADRVLEMAAEIEAGGDASFDGDSLDQARLVLHQWVDTMTGVVITPALGRITILHDKGIASTIASPDLPFTMSTPVGTRPDDWI